MPVVKVGRSRQVVIPKEIWDALELNAGDFFEVEEHHGRIVFIPKRLVDVEELIFWSKQSQEGLKEALQDVRKGRVSIYKSAEEAIRDLRS